MPAVGDQAYGGTVFYVNATEEYALVVRSVDVSDLPYTNSSLITSITTSEDIATGMANTNLLSSVFVDGEAGYEAVNSTVGGRSDWYVPSKDTMNEMWNSRASSGVSFSANKYYFTSSKSTASSSSVWIISGYNGVLTDSSSASTNKYTKIVRKQITAQGGVSIYDADETVLNNLSTILFGDISFPTDERTQIIDISLRSAGSILLSTRIDMANLNENYLATPLSLFGAIPDLRAVTNLAGDIYYTDTAFTSTLTSIANATVYQLTFAKSVTHSLSITGVPLTFPFTYSIPMGISWLPIVSTKDHKIFRDLFTPIDLAKITKITDLQTGAYYPRGRLETLKAGAGYIIEVTAPFNVTFK